MRFAQTVIRRVPCISTLLLTSARLMGLGRPTEARYLANKTLAIGSLAAQTSIISLCIFCNNYHTANAAGVQKLQGHLQDLVSSTEHQDKASVNAAQQSWRQIVQAGSAEDLPKILSSMKGVGPLTENWLRSAADAIAEREFSQSGKLPSEKLEQFVLDLQQAPRARRVAYEWLTKVDRSTPERLLPQMLDDPSLEIRYDAIARQLELAAELSSDQEKLDLYKRLLRSARDHVQLKACAEALKALGQEPNMAKEMGFLIQWNVIGPFDNSERKGFEQVFPPEQSVNLEEEYAGKNGAVTWKKTEAEQQDLEKLGIVDLNVALVEEKSVLAYAQATFVAAENMQVECRYESNQATKLWVNGKPLAASNVYHSGSDFDQHIVPCQLKQGENQILIKVCQNEQTESWTKSWDFRLRVTDKLGGAIQPAE